MRFPRALITGQISSSFLVPSITILPPTMETTTTTACVTGAGGFVASWLVKLLLSRGGRYAVHGTVRDPGDAKNAHLPALDGAAERLRLFKADLLDYGTIAAAVAGCDVVFHVACPVLASSTPNPEADLLAPAVNGTMNVLKACSEANVKRVVMVSSVAAVMVNPNWPQGKPMDEDCWSDVDYCRTTQVRSPNHGIVTPHNILLHPDVTIVLQSISGLLKQPSYRIKLFFSEIRHVVFSFGTPPNSVSHHPVCQNWYYLAKTLAELEAFDYSMISGLDVVTVCPSLVIGPLLQPTVNASSSIIVDFLKGDHEVKSKIRNFVDVRDVADALILVYETPGTSGRYICNSHATKVSDVIDLLKTMYPTYKFANKFVQVSDEPSFSSRKLEMLGWKVRTLEETLRDGVKSYRTAGVLD